MIGLKRSSKRAAIAAAKHIQKRTCVLSATLKEASPYFQIDAPISDTYEFRDTAEHTPFPVYRCMNEEGVPLRKDFSMPMSEELALQMYECMAKVEIFDDIFYKMCRVGKTSFYMENCGEEAASVGSSAAWTPEDVIFYQYRELGSFLWRGYSIQQCADTNFTNARGHGNGRQMPVHYGSKELKCVTVSSPLATQMPQAAGAGYALKREGKKAISVCYFGDGAASEGDAHVAFNFSATTESPVIWFCRNNGYAISTPTVDQYRGDGISARAHSYGMIGSRFDGNDIFAVYEVSKKAREIAANENRPIMLEAMTYRGSHHSTSDDASTYREAEEQEWWNHVGNPMRRMRNFLLKELLWDDAREKQMIAAIKTEVMEAAAKAEACVLPHWHHLFTHVYDEEPQRIKDQIAEMEKHLEKYGHEKFYSLHRYSHKNSD